MKFTCEREKMLSAFLVAASVAPSRSPKTVLQHVLLTATEQETALMATDMEIGGRVEGAGVTVESPGRLLLPVDRFGPLLRESTDDKIVVEVQSSGTLVCGERSEVILSREDPDEFPEVEPFEETKYHQVAARLFREIIRRTVFATDTESGRYALGGVLLEFEPDKIIAVGTDGRRLAKMEGPAQSVNGHELTDVPTIIPARSMQIIERALADEDGEVLIAVRNNDVVVKGNRETIFTRLVEGRFPKWRDVFPQRREAVRVELAAGPLYVALRQASVVASDDSRGIDFAFGDGVLLLSGSTAEVGQSRVELPISYEGPPITVTLDYRFVSDFLKVLDGEKVFTLEVEDGESAALFTTDDGYAYVVMPLARNP